MLKKIQYYLDKPRIEMFLEEFKQYYGGFVNILCRINAVPRPKHLEMRVGGIIKVISPQKNMK